jgi:hypothetical protein
MPVGFARTLRENAHEEEEAMQLTSRNHLFAALLSLALVPGAVLSPPASTATPAYPVADPLGPACGAAILDGVVDPAECSGAATQTFQMASSGRSRLGRAGALPAQPASGIWSALGAGTNGPLYAVAVDGSDVYVGGSFTSAGDVAANHIARWDGGAWSALGAGTSGTVNAIAVSGGDVYVGGDFTGAGIVTANHIARWDGATWSALGTGTDDAVYQITACPRDTAIDPFPR